LSLFLRVFPATLVYPVFLVLKEQLENQVNLDGLQISVIKTKQSSFLNLTEFYIISGLKGQPGDNGAPGLSGLPGQIGDAGMNNIIFSFYLILYLSIVCCRCSGKFIDNKQEYCFSSYYYRASQALLVHRDYQVR